MKYRLNIAACLFALFTLPANAVEFSLYGDTSIHGGTAPGHNISFSLGHLNLYTTQDVSEKTRAFTELVFSATDHGFETEIERMWIERNLNDQWSFRAGRMHSPLGFWNFNYHHGVLIQDTVTRPFFLQFEEGHEGLFPTHLIGLMTRGQLRRGNHAWQLIGAIGNGPSINSYQSEHGAELQVNNLKDLNSKKMLIGRVSYTNVEKRFQLGAFVMKNDIAESAEFDGINPVPSWLDTGDSLFDQTVSGADFRWSQSKFYLMGELFYIRSVDKIANPVIAPVIGAHNSYTAYLQAGLRVVDKFTPVIRIEGSEIHADDSYYALRDIQQEQRHILGFRYELDDSSALRFEINHVVPKAGAPHSTFTLQWFYVLF